MTRLCYFANARGADKYDEGAVTLFRALISPSVCRSITATDYDIGVTHGDDEKVSYSSRLIDAVMIYRRTGSPRAPCGRLRASH